MRYNNRFSLMESLDEKMDNLKRRIETNEGKNVCEQCGGMKEMKGYYDESSKMCECWKNGKKSKKYLDESEEEGLGAVSTKADSCVAHLKLASKEDADDAAVDFAENECMNACNENYKETIEYQNLSKQDKEMFDMKCMEVKGTSESSSSLPFKTLSDLNEARKRKLSQRQKDKIDVNNNNKIDSEDFKMLRKDKNGYKSKEEVDEDEMEEGNAFTKKLGTTKKGGKFTFNGKTYRDKSNYDIKENFEYHVQDKFGDIVKLNEEELIDLIEDIIVEDKVSNIKSMGKPKGLTTFEKAHKESGRENDDYIKSAAKKLGDYIKSGSKGKYDMNPKMFPQSNDQLGKMEKKAFKMTDELEDFNYEIAGQNFPYPDEIGYNEEWMEKLVKGHSTTGNAPGGNALKSDTNDRFDKIRKSNTLKKIKDQSYNRVSQPVFNEKPGSQKGKGLKLKTESVNDKEVTILNEEFDRIKNLFSYNRKTQ